ncbi:mitochondrial transcription rescue factor 1-like isoform X2 [Pollicipes pollicipes]|nr:mitochondrial transcription rescue factor 1-like [Pollicipes pollicipes]XP_037094608.1 mitochondrial transcription rescue factor 1-like isoform X2 [Pollicipes pollicipes]
MSRNKVDNAFYSSSIYLNGEKLIKKSHPLTVDDEVDVVRGENALNTSFLDVSRVQVLDIHRSRSDPDKLTLKVRRFKQLTVENYSSPWKPIASE